jgi:hypothetical protein
MSQKIKIGKDKDFIKNKTISVQLQISNPDDIKWIQSLDSDKKEKYIQSAITIGRLSMNFTNMTFNPNDYFNPVINNICKQITPFISSCNNLEKRLEYTDNNIQNYISSSLSPLNDQLDILSDEVNRFTSSSRTSSLKGKMGENKTFDMIETFFHLQGDEVTITASTANESDMQVKTKYGNILVEVKTYQSTVSKKEKEKFIRDMKNTKSRAGIFISHTSKIVGVKEISWEILPSKQIIMYVPQTNFDNKLITFCLGFLKELISHKDPSLYKINVLETWQTLENEFIELELYYKNVSKLSNLILQIQESTHKQLSDLYREATDIELNLRHIIEKILGNVRKELKKLSPVCILETKKTDIIKIVDSLRENDDNRYKSFQSIYQISNDIDCSISIQKDDPLKWVLYKKNKKLAMIKANKTKVSIIIDSVHATIIINNDSLALIRSLLSY